MIDGDSLLELLLSHGVTLLDWSFGGQSLHLVELVERFLQQFVLRNVKLQIVFFGKGTWLWRSRPGVLVVRAALIDHLRTRASSKLLEVVEFDSFASQEWTAALAELDPNWILCFDASLTQNKETAAYFSALCNHHIMIFHCNVVMVPGLEFRGNDVEAWVQLERGASLSDQTDGEWSGYVPIAKASSEISAEDAVKKAAGEQKESIFILLF